MQKRKEWNIIYNLRTVKRQEDGEVEGALTVVSSIKQPGLN